MLFGACDLLSYRTVCIRITSLSLPSSPLGSSTTVFWEDDHQDDVPWGGGKKKSRKRKQMRGREVENSTRSKDFSSYSAFFCSYLLLCSLSLFLLLIQPGFPCPKTFDCLLSAPFSFSLASWQTFRKKNGPLESLTDYRLPHCKDVWKREREMRMMNKNKKWNQRNGKTHRRQRDIKRKEWRGERTELRTCLFFTRSVMM